MHSGAYGDPSCQHLLNACLQGIVIYQILLLLVKKILSPIYTILCIPLTNKLIFFFNTIDSFYMLDAYLKNFMHAFLSHMNFKDYCKRMPV